MDKFRLLTFSYIVCSCFEFSWIQTQGQSTYIFLFFTVFLRSQASINVKNTLDTNILLKHLQIKVWWFSQCFFHSIYLFSKLFNTCQFCWVSLHFNPSQQYFFNFVVVFWSFPLLLMPSLQDSPLILKLKTKSWPIWSKFLNSLL